MKYCRPNPNRPPHKRARNRGSFSTPTHYAVHASLIRHSLDSLVPPKVAASTILVRTWEDDFERRNVRPLFPSSF